MMAEPLGALEGPRFVRDSSVPAPGWYWTPHDAAGRVWLGRNLQAASRRLIELREARLQPHPDTNQGGAPPPPQRPDRTEI